MCNCGKRSGSGTRRPAVGPGPAARRGLASSRTPSDMRAIRRAAARDNKGIPANARAASTQKRRLIEKKRRDMILRKLGR